MWAKRLRTRVADAEGLLLLQINVGMHAILPFFRFSCPFTVILGWYVVYSL